MSSEEWAFDALCRQGDPEMWFPDRINNGHDTETAKRWCRACPVLAQCRAYALREEGDEPAETRYGIWGGMTPRERKDLFETSRARGVVAG